MNLSNEVWDEISIENPIDKCPKCKTGTMVYSHKNNTLRVGSHIEYYYCIQCNLNTGVKTK